MINMIMQKMKVYSIIVLLLTASCMLFAQEKRALVVGIGQYEDPSWGRINADKDLEYVGKILDMYGFEDVVYLRNETATKAAIVEAFVNITERSDAGDVVYVHFSGHGQQMKDLDGDEDDGCDESWIPYDAYRKCGKNDDGSKHLSDDEINVMLLRLRGKVGSDGHILVVADACHSGESSRSAEHVEDGYVRRGVNDVFVPSYESKHSVVVEEDWLLISACEDYQVNFEVQKPRVGKLTYCLYKLRKDLPKMSNEGLMAKLYELMESSEMISPLPQNPHLDGGKYRAKDVFKK